jgi:hypothetical protein
MTSDRRLSQDDDPRRDPAATMAARRAATLYTDGLRDPVRARASLSAMR